MGLKITDNVVSQMDNKYRGDETFFGGDAVLPKWVGYLIVVGFGAFFSVFTTLIMCAGGVLCLGREGGPWGPPGGVGGRPRQSKRLGRASVAFRRETVPFERRADVARGVHSTEGPRGDGPW